MERALAQYQKAKRDNMLLMLPFVSIGDYLHALRAVSRALAPAGPRGMLYLAAAVSDFYILPEHMATHKIQSVRCVCNLVASVTMHD